MPSPTPGGRSDPPTGRPPSTEHATQGTLGAVVTAAVIAGLFVAFLAPLPTYNPDARTLPLVIGVPATVLALVNVVRQVVLWRRARGERQRAGQSLPTLRLRLRRLITPRDGDATSVAAAIGWLVAAAAAMLLLGFFWGSAVFMPAFMLLYGRERPTTILLYAGGLLVVLYVVFITGLNVPYFPGIFAD
jgi:hypothetical protein